MNRDAVEKIARAILYEGYVLYPYRPSVKTRQRWTFGGLYPKTWSDEQAGSDAWTMQTECLLNVAPDDVPNASVDIVVQFLHLLDRTVGRLASPVDRLPADGDIAFSGVDSLTIGDAQYNAWQEATERRVEVGTFRLAELLKSPRQMSFAFDDSRAIEPIGDEQGKITAVMVRQQQAIAGEAELSCALMGDDLFKLSVRVLNRTGSAEAGTRDDALMRAMVSTHTILGIDGGQFISAIDPPARWRAQSAECRNIGAFPVLIGEGTETDTMLSSPIILYDYPRIAAESAGDLFDGTEIDEILTLRILTLTDEEKRSAAGNDERVRALLSRTESLARENLMGLHGVFRPVAPTLAPSEESHG